MMNRFQTLLSLSTCGAGSRAVAERVETSVESAWFRLSKLKYDEPLSNFAFNFNLRRYIWDGLCCAPSSPW